MHKEVVFCSRHADDGIGMSFCPAKMLAAKGKIVIE